MPLTSPIPLVLTDDPVTKYQEIAATIPEGSKYVQEFDHLCVENLDVTESKYLEDMYPNATILGADGKLDSWDGHQSLLGACGSFALGNAYGSVPDGCQYKAEDSIYPLEPSKIGLYFARIQSPLNPLQTTWMAIDSRVATKPGANKSAFFSVTDSLAPGLLLKARASAMGGAWNEITNHPSFSQSMNWFPCVTVTCKTFDELKTAISRGALCVFSLAQQYDALGQKITPSGIVYGHAYSIADMISVMHNGELKQLVRMQNPWGSGSEWASSVSEGSEFWLAHPDLAQKEADAKASGGNYWIDWNDFKGITGKTEFDVKVPLIQPEYPNVATLTYTFDETTAIASNLLSSLWPLAATRKDYIAVTVTEPTEIQIEQSWKSGTGNRHAMLKIQNVAKTFTLVTPTGYWGAVKNNTVSFPSAGTYYIFPNTTNMMVDRGELQLIFQSAKVFELKRLGAIA